jgi:hypothetical protein
VLASTKPAANPASWTRATINPGYIDGLSCPSVSMCVAVDMQGNVITSTDPTGPASAWKTTYVDPATIPSSCVGPDGQKAQCRGQAAISGVSCPTTSFCVAVDQAGNALVSRSPTAGPGGWRLQQADRTGAALDSVSCPSTSLCVAGDNGGNLLTSIDPAGGHSWRVTSIAPNEGRFDGVSCRSPALCVTYGPGVGVMASTNPAAGTWTRTPIYGEHVFGVSCPTLALCVAVTSQGDATVSRLLPPRPRLSATLRSWLQRSLRDLTIHSLLSRRGTRFVAQVPTAGRLTIEWYLDTGHAEHMRGTSKPVGVVLGSATSGDAAATEVMINLTRRGRTLLKHAKSITLDGRATFAPYGRQSVTARATLKLRR